MQDFLTALALVFVIEGLTLAVVPGLVRRMLAHLDQAPQEVLRFGGIVSAGLGILVVWLIRG